MSGEVSPNDIQFCIMAIRRGYHKYTSEVGEANKKRAAEKLRLQVEEERQAKLEAEEVAAETALREAKERLQAKVKLNMGNR